MIINLLKNLKMKKTLVTLSFILFSYTGFSQDIKIDKNIISVDGKECLKIGDDSDSNNVSIQDLEGNDIVFLKFIHNSKYGPLYNKITFLNLQNELVFCSSD